MGLRTSAINVFMRLWNAGPGPRGRRLFEAARFSRLDTDFWGGFGSADSEIRGSLRLLRNRSRKLCRDNPYAKQAKRTIQTNVIGPRGVQLRASAKKADGLQLDARRNKILEESFALWCRADTCDVAGRLSFHGFEQMIAGALPESGEAVIRLVRQPFGNGKTPLALEIIESDQLDEMYSGISDRPGHRWRLGVELNEWNRPTRYAILTRHPGDSELGAQQSEAQRHIFLDAKDIILIFLPDRVGQTRGVPWFSTVALTANALAEYEKAHWTKKRVQASSLGWIQTPEGELSGDEVVNDQRLLNTEPGSWNYLGPGENAIPPDFGADDGQYDNVVRNLLRRFAAGMGCSYETLSRDFSQSNYSSSRLSVLEDRDHWRVIQSMIIQQFHQRVYEEWLDAAMISGILPIDTFKDYWVRPERYTNPRWQARTWSWVDPSKELDAIKTARELLLESHGEQISDFSGEEFEAVMAQIAHENEIKDSLGLPLVIDQKANQSSIASGGGPQTPGNDSSSTSQQS
jgi:lambda family phage portal protein